MKRAAKFASILAVATALTAPSLALAESLGDALVSAYKNSGLLQQNQALLRAADEDVAAATAAMRPVLDYTLSSNYSTISKNVTTNLSLSASMSLYDNGSSKLRREIAKENVLSLREGLRSIEQNVLLQAVSAYTNVRRDTSIVSLRRSNLRLVRQELQATNDRFEVGEITRTEVALAEARVASAQAALAVAQGNLNVSREDFRLAVGRYPTTLDTTPNLPSLPANLASALAQARTNHPDMAQAQHAVNVAELNVKLAENNLKPSLTGSINGSIDQDGNDSATVGVRLAGPIYRGGALLSSIRKVNAQRDASRAGLYIARQNVERQAGVAWTQLELASSALRATDEQIKAFRVAFEGVQEEANLGARTSLDVLNAEQDLLDAEADKFSAESDRYVAVYSLLAAMGKLNTKTLGLGVATYDPAAYYEAVKDAPLAKVSAEGKKLDKVLSAIGKSSN